MMKWRSLRSWRIKQIFEIMVSLANLTLEQWITGIKPSTLESQNLGCHWGSKPWPANYNNFFPLGDHILDQRISTSLSQPGFEPLASQFWDSNHTLIIIGGRLPLHHDCWWWRQWLSGYFNRDPKTPMSVPTADWRRLTRQLVMIADETPRQKQSTTFTR